MPRRFFIYIRLYTFLLALLSQSDILAHRLSCNQCGALFYLALRNAIDEISFHLKLEPATFQRDMPI